MGLEVAGRKATARFIRTAHLYQWLDFVNAFRRKPFHLHQFFECSEQAMLPSIIHDAIG
jgi:hypothetical protein